MQRRKRKKGPAPRKQADGVVAKPSDGRKPLRPAVVAAALFLLCLTCYLANSRTSPTDKSGDTVPNRLLPFSALAFHTLTLDPFAAELAPGGDSKWYTRYRRGHLVGLYPIGPAMVAFPIYLPAWAWLSASGRATAADLSAASPGLEKFAASVIAALAVVFVYLTLRRWISARAAFLASVGLGLGTSMWATASQMLWQHGPVALGIAAGVFFLTDPERSMRSASLAGLAYSLAIASRPTAALFWMAAIAALLLERRPLRQRFIRAAWFAAAGIPAVLFSSAFNVYWYSTPLGGYSLAVHALEWRDLPKRAAGLLLSPNRGLFVFTPIALLGIIGLVRSFRRIREEPHLPTLAIAATVHFLLISGYLEWVGGWSFGPRYMVDVLPILALGAGCELPRLGRGASVALAIAFVWSALVQWNGAFCYPASRWDVRTARDVNKAVWDWGQFELWQDFQQWRASPFWATRY
jgi:hypothetical protein